MKPEQFPPTSPLEDLVDFPELFRTIRRYQWGIIGITTLAAAAAILYCYSATPIYRGTVTLLIESKSARAVQIQDVYDPGVGTTEYYGTQYGILRSRDLAVRTVSKLGLVDNKELAGIRDPDEQEGLLRRYLPFLPPPPPRTPGAENEARRLEAAVQAVRSRVSVEPVRGSQLVNLHFEAESPKLAADVANAMADLFIESGL